ncbi:MAG TPA: folylpolyglutamate synthase/dihydrofolate synthase family protein [Candidatus Angelobacter sp.]|nr:folylpolyglutamate synthase/dihydrofolate synthase family protein [Candidatus Angelobacter sp.]
MIYREVIQFLYDLRLFGAKFGLENTFKLAALAGNPQEKLRFIHVAGTNGKGSTCAMLESIYRAAGLRVGLFTSPHLVSFRERIQVNRQLVNESDVVRLLEEMQPWLEEFPKDHHPTFFEVVTVMALRYFAEKKCDLVIWETGMGGRFDATNIVVPLASVITNISFDHQQWLGDTLAKIAGEKAGIIKPGVPVVTTADAPEALAIIEETARRLNAPLVKAGETFRSSRAGSLTALSLAGKHQERNAAAAIAIVETLRRMIPVRDETIRIGLESVQWPGRLQVVKSKSGQTVLLDGAHNAAGADALRDALETYYPSAKPALILGVLEDKDWRHLCEALAPLAMHILPASVNSERTTPPERLRDACAIANPGAQVTACPSLADALKEAADAPFVVITGSLYLVGEAMELLGLSPTTSEGERELNEWSAKK